MAQRTRKTKGTKSTTVVRKALQNTDTLSIVKDYAEGELSVREIALKHNTSESNVSLAAKRFWKSLTNMRESRALVGETREGAEHFDSKNSLKELRGTELINTEFQKMLSSDDSKLLSDAEATYCWTYVHTGDIKESLDVSGLDVGLFREKKRDSRFSYDRAVILRGHYLNAKPNVANYIKELREQRLINADVGKSRIQSELIDQLEFMKASGDPKHRKEILRCIELLGKTVGAFTERIEVREIDPANALDQLIEMAQEAEVTEINEDDVKELND